MLKDTIWYYKYQPQTVKDCFLPAAARKIVDQYVAAKDIPNLLLCGSPGIGKTTVALALVNDIGAEHLFVPASIKGNIDTLRNEIQQFASTIALNGQKKYVILDEADNLTPHTQLALRGFIDQYRSNCGFIFTCNFREKILQPISESRLTEISFNLTAEDKVSLAKSILAKLVEIFDDQSISYKLDSVKQFLISYLKKTTDIRRLLVEMQKSCVAGTFDPATLVNLTTERFQSLFSAIKAANFTQVRTWVGENTDIDPSTIFRQLYNNYTMYGKHQMIGAAVLILAKYQYQQSFVADSELNITACIVELMAECV